MLLSSLMWSILALVLYLIFIVLGVIVSYKITDDAFPPLFFILIYIVITGVFLNINSSYTKDKYYDQNFKTAFIEKNTVLSNLGIMSNELGLNIRVKDLTPKLIHLEGVNKKLKDSYDEDNVYVNDYKAYYDTINIKLIQKEIEDKITFLDFLGSDPNYTYEADCVLTKNTEELKLKGSVRSTVENGETKIYIGDYVLSNNEKISPLINRDNVSIDIVYDKTTAKGNNISDYLVINAN